MVVYMYSHGHLKRINRILFIRIRNNAAKRVSGLAIWIFQRIFHAGHEKAIFQ